MQFENPLVLWLLIAVVLIVIGARRRRIPLPHSKIALHANLTSFLPLRLLLSCTLAFSLASGVIALSHPTTIVVEYAQALVTRAIDIMVDVSGSMNDVLSDTSPSFMIDAKNRGIVVPEYDPVKEPKPTKAQAAYVGVCTFVDARKDDRIGFQVFDMRVYMGYPLTMNHNRISEKLPLIVTNKAHGGTNFDGPSRSTQNIGAIQGGIDHLLAMGKEKTRVLVMVTDGEDSIDPTRAAALKEQIDSNHLRMYVIGVGPAWKTGTPDLKRFVESVNGRVFIATNADELLAGIEEINKLEASRITVGTIEKRKDVGFVFIYASIASLFMFVALGFLVRDEN
jgi:hypothetical protein